MPDRPDPDDTTLPQRIARISTGIALALAAWLIILHGRMIVSPAPQEMREGASVWITRLLLEGRNPYALSELPAGTNVYGILYHLAVVPFAWWFGNGFVIHRVVSGIAIAGACALMYRMLRRTETDPLMAAAGVLLFYASSLYFVAPVARPDGLGLLLSMASMTVLFRARLTWPPFLWGLGLALLGLATKVYFAFPPFVMAAYVSLYVSRSRGLVYLLTSATAAVVVLLALSAVYPAYITLSLVANLQTGYADGQRLLDQTIDWLVFSLPLTVALAIVTFQALKQWSDIPRWLARPSVFAFASVTNAVVFLCWLGWHPGAHMTYLFQLVTPVLIPALLPQLSKTSWPRAAVAAALPLALLLDARYVPLTFARFRLAEASFQRLSDTIAVHPRVLGSTEVAGLLALANRPVLDSGQSEYFREAIPDRRLPFVPPAPVLRARWDVFVDQMSGDIRDQRFDLIVRSRRNGLIPRDVVSDHYRRTGTVDLDFAWAGQSWPVDLWEPAPEATPRETGENP